MSHQWERQSRALTAWFTARMVNRTDVWGGYLPLQHRDDGKKVVTKPRRELRGQVKLTTDIIARHCIGADVADVIGLHAIGDDGLSRWMAVDLDNHGSADAQANTAYAVHLYDVLISLGFQPLLIDSDGRGGFHLIVVFARPVPSPIAHAFAKWLVLNHTRHGIADPPECYPRQPNLDGLEYGNWLRLPGRHHTRDHWSKVWDGVEFRDGAPAIQIILNTTGDDLGLIPGDAAPKPRPAPSAREATNIPAERVRFNRAEKYINRMPASVSGQRGHDRLLAVACTCRRFGLSESDALCLMRLFNERCSPPWSDKDVVRKWSEAVKKVTGNQIGSLLIDRGYSPRRWARPSIVCEIGGAA